MYHNSYGYIDESVIPMLTGDTGIFDSSDNTKELNFDLSSLSSNSTRILSIPDRDVDIIGRITNTKGDLMVDNGTTMVDLSVGVDGSKLVADSSNSTGLSWVLDTVNTDPIYYIGSTGLDTNDGLTSGSPFLTINKVFSVLQSILWDGKATIVITTSTLNLGANPTWNINMHGSIVIVGIKTILDSRIHNTRTTNTTGEDWEIITPTIGGMTVNLFQGKIIQSTSGTYVDQSTYIFSNDATTLTSQAANIVSASSTYDIIEPGTTLIWTGKFKITTTVVRLQFDLVTLPCTSVNTFEQAPTVTPLIFTRSSVTGAGGLNFKVHNLEAGIYDTFSLIAKVAGINIDNNGNLMLDVHQLEMYNCYITGIGDLDLSETVEKQVLIRNCSFNSMGMFVETNCNISIRSSFLGNTLSLFNNVKACLEKVNIDTAGNRGINANIMCNVNISSCQISNCSIGIFLYNSNCNISGLTATSGINTLGVYLSTGSMCVGTKAPPAVTECQLGVLGTVTYASLSVTNTDTGSTPSENVWYL
jgi:hypothetical protein